MNQARFNRGVGEGEQVTFNAQFAIDVDFHSLRIVRCHLQAGRKVECAHSEHPVGNDFMQLPGESHCLRAFIPLPGSIGCCSFRAQSHFPFAFRAARAWASLISKSARCSSSGRSKKLSITYNPRSSSGCSLSILQSLKTQAVNASCSVEWSISSVHFTNSQRS